MIRKHWRDPSFWSWWWRNRVSADSKIAVALITIFLVGLGGFFAANGLSGTVGAEQATNVQATTAQVAEVRTVTVSRLVTIRDERDRRPVSAPPRVVTVEGPARTVVVEDATPPRTVVVTEAETIVRTSERLVTSERVVTRPITSTRVVTERVPVTQTVHSTQTVHVTETVPTTVTVTVTTKKGKGGGGDDEDDD